MSVDDSTAGDVRRAEPDARNLLERVRWALDELTDAYVMVCDADLRIQLVRGGLLDYLGIEPDVAEGRALAEVAGADRWELLASAFAAALAGTRRDVDVRSADGSRTFHLVITPVIGAESRPDGVVVMAFDDTESRRVHEALVESEERFRLLAENSSDFVMRTTSDGTIEWISASITDVLGWEPEEMVGKRSLDFAHPDVVAAVLRDTTQVNVGATVSGRIQVRCKDGSHKWMTRTLRPVYGEHGDVVARVSGWHDAEVEVAAERAIAESEETFRLAMDTASIGMFVCSRDKIFVRVNPALCRMLGRTEEELYTLTFEDVTHPSDLELSREAMQGVSRGWSEKAHLRKRYVRADGGIVWGDTSVVIVRDSDGIPRHVLGQIVDVSVEVANFEAMQRAAADLRLLAENASDVVLRINEHGVITWVSPSVRTVLGWEPDVLVGTPSLSLIEHADHERVNANRAAMRDGSEGAAMVVRYRTTWGETREMSGRVRPLRDENGAYRGGIVGLRDVTAEQQMRRELAYRATHDALTGVANRDDLLDRLRSRLALESRPRLPVGVLFLDVDNLKAVNDAHGHSVGDAVLVEIAARLVATVRREDVVARLSGDEFVVMVYSVENADRLESIAEKCRAAVAGAVTHKDVSVATSVSIGGVLAELDDDADEVLDRADRAVYLAKTSGRNQVRVERGPA